MRKGRKSMSLGRKTGQGRKAETGQKGAETGQEDWNRAGRLRQSRKAETGQKGAEMWTGGLEQGRKAETGQEDWNRAGRLEHGRKALRQGRKT